VKGDDWGYIFEIIINGYSWDPIVEKLLFRRKNLGFVVNMGHGHLESGSADVDAEFIFYKCLVRIEAFHVIRLLFFLFNDDFLNEFFRFAFSLDECQDVVYVIGDYIPFINEVYLF